MRKHIDDMFSREIANMVKIDSNDVQAETGVDLIKLIEEGHIIVAGLFEGHLLYIPRECYAEAEQVFS